MIEQRVIVKDGKRILQQREATNPIQCINGKEPAKWTKWEDVDKNYKD